MSTCLVTIVFVSCRVCSHESRVEIEAAIGEGADLYELAARFELTKAALAKHARCAPQKKPARRAPKASVQTATPPKASAVPKASVQTAAPPKATVVLKASAPEDEDDDDEEEAPATSRSGEIISGRAITATAPARTAREKVERLVDSLQLLLDEVSETRERPDGQEVVVPLDAKLAVLRAMVQPLRLLGTFTGEIGASESTVASSPFYRRVRTAVVDALRPHPEAARAVIDALERIERGAPDLEAAAE